MPKPTDITSTYAYWNLTFEDPITKDKTRLAIPIEDPAANPTLGCIPKDVSGDWRLTHETFQQDKKLVIAELLPISSSFVAADAVLKITPIYPGSGKSLALTYRIPSPGESDTVAVASLSADPSWTLKVKVKKRLRP